MNIVSQLKTWEKKGFKEAESRKAGQDDQIQMTEFEFVIRQNKTKNVNNLAE